MPFGFCQVCSYMFLPSTSSVHIQDLHIRQLPSRWPEKKLGPCGTLRSSETNESPSRGEWHKKEKMGEVEGWQQGMQNMKNSQVSSEMTRKHESSDRTVHVRLLRVWLLCCFVDLGQAVRVQQTWYIRYLWAILVWRWERTRLSPTAACWLKDACISLPNSSDENEIKWINSVRCFFGTI